MLEQIGPDLQKFAIEVFRLALWLTILVAVFVPLERLFAAHRQPVWRRGIVTDLGYYFLTSLLPALLLSFPISLLCSLVRRFIPADFLQATASLPLVGQAVAGMVVGEVGYYWAHRWSHEVPWLWKFHSIHHSATQLDFLVSSRAHPVDLVFSRFCSLAPLYVLGLGGPGDTNGSLGNGSLVPVIVTLIGTVWGFFIHANLRWRFGPVEWLISTPAFHHWHHTRNGPFNRNFASNLPWLDRIFGTHYLPRNELPDAYGIKSAMPDSLLDQLSYPFETRKSADAVSGTEIADD